MASGNIKGIDGILNWLENLKKEIEKGTEEAVREIGGEYHRKVRARLLVLAGEYEGQEPAYVSAILLEMADNLKLETKKGKDGYYATLGWEDGAVEDAENILFGNREILPVDVFGDTEEEMVRAFEGKIRQYIEKLLT